MTRLKPQHSPSCRDCKNVYVIHEGCDDEFWSCETIGWGMPMKCSPPYDDPCPYFNDAGALDRMDHFIANAQAHDDDE